MNNLQLTGTREELMADLVALYPSWTNLEAEVRKHVAGPNNEVWPPEKEKTSV